MLRAIAKYLRQAGSTFSQDWLAENQGPVERCVQVLADIRTAGSPDLARLSVAVREVRNLINASGAPESVQDVEAVPG